MIKRVGRFLGQFLVALSRRVAYFLWQLAGFPFLVALNIVASAYVLAQLWGWFAVPLFNVPSLTIAQAAGLVVLGNFLLNRPYHYAYLLENDTDEKGEKSLVRLENDTDEEGEKSLVRKVVTVALLTVARPAAALAIGYVVRLFV